MSVLPVDTGWRNVLTAGNAHTSRPGLGPSGIQDGDHLGMVGFPAGMDPWQVMASPHRHGDQPARRPLLSHRRELARILVLVLSLLALVLTSSALNWITEARAAGGDAVSSAQAGAKRAVIVSGPVHSLTTRYRRYARAMAVAAEAQGMDVRRIFHPNATKDRVIEHANGADLFIYIGHGNGWPGPIGPFREDTKNGLGLNPDDPEARSTSNVVYLGADWLKANIEFAPNAVVILSHLSYASGNASSGMTIPSREVAVERIDNFANGFLAAGARVVWALGWQPGADVISALYGEDSTMDAVFMTRYRDGVGPLSGWIGASPGYHESVRTPGAVLHVDPDPNDGYLRGITGDLGLSTTEWRDPSARPLDTEPPVITELNVSQAPATIASDDSGPPAFTPNGDGVSDSIRISHLLSESAFLDIRISKGGKVVRDTSIWSMGGRGSTTWDGRRDSGEYAAEGRYRIDITPTDRAGNSGQAASTKVLVLSSLRAPRATPALFNPSDGDGLAATTTLKARLIRPATVSWIVRDASGAVVRHGPDRAQRQPGDVRFVWDGTDDAGQRLPDGTYTGRIRVTRPLGSYGHEVTVHMMPFRLVPSRWRVGRGETIRLVFTSAEPLMGTLAATFKQPGLEETPFKVRRSDDHTFRSTLTTLAESKRGKLSIRVAGTDEGGGAQSQVFDLKLR